ncbi:FAR1-related protein [Striga asiatica]|uniref:FAR1-related protein n=1 Tax=Striga asiatica TaxID=4170 RepID=A0A5A7P8A7_STRAF|nr:FAR1-related protein [Striga asiatica]
MELNDTQTERGPTDKSQHHRLLISPGGTKYWIPECDDTLKPHNGQRFRSLNEAVEFYQLYASTVGFDARHSTLVKSRDNTVLWKYLVCSREGYKQRAKTGQPVLNDNRVLGTFNRKCRGCHVVSIYSI